jgi:hypothetical protein
MWVGGKEGGTDGEREEGREGERERLPRGTNNQCVCVLMSTQDFEGSYELA